MSERNFDELLDAVLAGEGHPDDLTPAERAGLDAMLSVAGALREVAPDIRTEAEASLPVARARFERARAEIQPRTSAAKPGARRRTPGRWLTFGSLAAAAVAVAAIVALRPFGRATETVNAIEAGDFVQLEGTVESVDATEDARRLQLATAVGRIELVVSGDTAVTDGSQPLDAEAITPGEGIAFAGVAQDSRRVAATTVAALRGLNAVAPGDYEVLKDARAGIEGIIVFFALADGGGSADVLVELDSGRRLLAPVDAESVRRLAAEHPGLVGVRVTLAEGRRQGLFGLALARGGAATPVRGFVTVTGTVLSIERAQLVLETGGGEMTIRLGRDTRILLPSGEEVERPLLASRLLAGRKVSVQGATLRDGSVAAGLVVLAD